MHREARAAAKWDALRLQLSVLSLLGPHLNAENAPVLCEACSGKSCEQVELLLAARFPKPDVRDAIRRLPTRAAARTPNGDNGGCAVATTPWANPEVGVRRAPKPPNGMAGDLTPVAS